MAWIWPELGELRGDTSSAGLVPPRGAGRSSDPLAPDMGALGGLKMKPRGRGHPHHLPGIQEHRGDVTQIQT